MNSWKKQNILGAGSFGTVYLAAQYCDFDDNSSPALIAVKSSKYPFVTSLQNEGQILYELRGCPEIIRCYGDDISFENNQVAVYSLLLEYASGGTLSELIKKFGSRKISESKIAHYCQMVLKGLSHVHEEGFVHCDIKPSNILVFPNEKDYHLKIADFGLAKKIEKNEIFGYGQKKKFRGTPLYVSPESVAYGIQDPLTDIWSFGCVVAEMFTGTPIWKRSGNSSRKELFDNILHGEIKISRDISIIGYDFLEKCLKRDRTKRWGANMLLNHPFILQNMTTSPDYNKIDQRVISSHSNSINNPFELSQWSSTRDLFSTDDQIQRLQTTNHCLDASDNLVRNLFQNLSVK